MDDKKLTFKSSAEIDGKMTAGMARLVKTVQENQVKQIKFLQETTKGMDKWIKAEKELNKIQKNESNKLLKERETLLKNIGRAVDHNTKLYEKAEKTAQRFARWEARSVAKAWGMDPNSVDMKNPFWQQYASKGTGFFQARAATNIAGGVGMLASAQADQDEIRRAEQQKNISRLMAASMMTQVVGGAISGFGDYRYGASMKGLGYDAQRAGVAGRLYNEIVSGDFNSIFAMRGDRFNRLKGIVADTWRRSDLNITGSMVGGVGKVGMGVAQGAIAVQTGGVGGAAASLNAPGAVQGVIGGGMDIAGGFQERELGRREADQATGALQALDYLRALDPVKQRQFQELMARRSVIHRVGALTGQSGGLGFMGIAAAGMSGGLTAEEALPYWERLRSLGTGAANGLLGSAVTSLDRMGIDRGAATSSLLGFGSNLGGGSGAAIGALENTMRRAVAGGLKDSAIKEALATTVAEMSRSSLSRGGTTDVISSAIIREANALAASQGRNAEVSDVQLAAGGWSGLNKFTSGASGVGPIDVRMQWSKIRAFKEAGFAGPTLAAAGRLNVSDIMDGSRMFTDLAGARWQQIQQSFKGSVLSDITGTMPGASPADQATLLAPYVGGYEQARAMLGMAANLNPGAIGSDMGGMQAGTQQSSFSEANVSAATAQMSAIIRALSDEGMVSSMKNVAGAAVSIARSFEQMGEAELQKVPDLLNRVADALKNVGVAASNIVGDIPTGDGLPTTTGKNQQGPGGTTGAGYFDEHGGYRGRTR